MVDIAELGRRIRKLRLERRMTLKHVEQASGLSATHLSEIERGRTSPTIGALIRIARALDREASYFIEVEERSEVGYLTREARPSTRPDGGVTAETLTRGIPGSRVFAYRLVLDSNPPAELRMQAHELEGDVVYLVHQGVLGAEVGDTTLRLEPGDSAQVSFAKPHRIHSLGAESTEVIAIMTQPLEETRSTPSRGKTS
ncbi:MAG TPA: XRE family transcriptional regulator [Candidatus Limnocylindria bacterium]|nr:XRE family transcriptional regulator [Candidatus Limnocylindria bacterium]